MLRRLYDWTLSLAARKSAEFWLAVIAFIESSIFLIPADVLFLPMVLARPDRAYRYALIATVVSVLGGIAGWFIGYYAYETVAKPVLEFYGKLDDFEALRASSGSGCILLMLVTSGLAAPAADQGGDDPVGVIGVNIWLFIAVGHRRARRALLRSLPGCCAPMASRSRPFRRETARTASPAAAAAVLILLYFARQILPADMQNRRRTAQIEMPGHPPRPRFQRGTALLLALGAWPPSSARRSASSTSAATYPASSAWSSACLTTSACR